MKCRFEEKKPHYFNYNLNSIYEVSFLAQESIATTWQQKNAHLAMTDLMKEPRTCEIKPIYPQLQRIPPIVTITMIR